jgi:rod shape-determining protein MreD
MARDVLSYVLLSLLFLLLHTTLVRFLAIDTIVPDILLIWVVYLAIRRGQIAATTAGFLIGLVADVLAGTDGMLGLSALSKTVAGFVAGYSYNENKIYQTLGGYPFVVIVALASLVHNLIYFFIFLQGSDIGWWNGIVFFGLPTTIYTVAVSLLPMFAFGRKYLS